MVVGLLTMVDGLPSSKHDAAGRAGTVPETGTLMCDSGHEDREALSVMSLVRAARVGTLPAVSARHRGAVIEAAIDAGHQE